MATLATTIIAHTSRYIVTTVMTILIVGGILWFLRKTTRMQ